MLLEQADRIAKWHSKKVSQTFQNEQTGKEFRLLSVKVRKNRRGELDLFFTFEVAGDLRRVSSWRMGRSRKACEENILLAKKLR